MRQRWGSCFSGGDVRVAGPPLEEPEPEVFSFAEPLPPWPPGGGFARGRMSIGGGELELAAATSFQKICTLSPQRRGGGGVTFYRPVGVPEGFSLLGHYCQPNCRPLHGHLLVARAGGRAPGRRPASAAAASLRAAGLFARLGVPRRWRRQRQPWQCRQLPRPPRRLLLGPRAAGGVQGARVPRHDGAPEAAARRGGLRPRGPHGRVRAARLAAPPAARSAVITVVGLGVLRGGGGGLRRAGRETGAPGDVGERSGRGHLLLRHGRDLPAGTGHGVPEQRRARPVGDADAGAGARRDPALRPHALLPPQGGVPAVVRLLVLQERRRAVQARRGSRRGGGDRRRGVQPPGRRVQRRGVLDRRPQRRAGPRRVPRRHRQRGALRAPEAGHGRRVHRRGHVGVLPVQRAGAAQARPGQPPAGQDRAARRGLGALHAPRQQPHRRAHASVLLAAQRRALGGRVGARVHRRQPPRGVLVQERARELRVPRRVPAGLGGARDRHPQRRRAEQSVRGLQRQVPHRGGGVPGRGRRRRAAVAALHAGVGPDGGVQVEEADGVDCWEAASPGKVPSREDAE